MSHKPYLYLCENCKYKGVYPEGNKDNFEDWFCYKTKIISSYVPCIRIKHCEISNSEKELTLVESVALIIFSYQESP